MTLFDNTRAFVQKDFGDPSHMPHFDRTVHWAKYLNPDADEALLIAAIGHDIERSPARGGGIVARSNKGFMDKTNNLYHQEHGAEILGEFLQENGASKELVARVKHLVSRHEFGGDAEQNLLKDADSISFLENQGPKFLSRLGKVGYKDIKDKFDWMYNRITDPKAKKIAQPFYNELIEELDSLAAKK